MQKAVKAILASLLALMITVSPYFSFAVSVTSSAAKSGDGYTYIAAYISKYGKTDRNGNRYITTGTVKSNGRTHLARVFYKPATANFKLYCNFDSSTTVSIDTGKAENSKCSISVLSGNYSAAAKALPGSCDSSLRLSLTLDKAIVIDSSISSAMSSYLTEAAEIWNTLLSKKAGASLGSLGFTKMYDAAILSYIAAPEITKFCNSTNGVLIEWNKCKAESIAVFRKTQATGYKLITSLSGNSVKYTDKTAVDGTGYTYSLCAYSDNGISDINKCSDDIIRLSSPVIAVSNTRDSISVNWQPVEGALRYNIYRKENDESYRKLPGTFSKNTTSYSDNAVRSGSKYAYAVRAINGTYISSYVSKDIARVEAPAVSACNATNGPMVTWNAVDGATKYFVFRKDGSSYKKIGEVKAADTLRFIDKSKKTAGGETIKYAVRAYNKNYQGVSLSCSVLRLPTPDFSVTKAGNTVNLSWNFCSGSDGYYVYRKSSDSKYQRIAVLKSDVTKFSDSSTDSSEIYTYAVRAYKGNVMSSYVERSAVLPKAAHIENVPFYNQMKMGYPMGCEGFSGAMVLNYYGYNVTPQQLCSDLIKVPGKYKKNGVWYGGDPFSGFVGDPTKTLDEGAYGCFAPPLAEAMKKYAGNRVKDISGCDIETLYAYVASGHPVVVWGSSTGNTLKNSITWKIVDKNGNLTDDSFQMIKWEHCMVLVGYDTKNVFLNNPSWYADYEQTKVLFEANWNKLYKQAVVIE